MVEFFVATLEKELRYKGKLSSVQAAQFLHKAYLLRYNLATEHELTLNPAALVKMRNAEDGHMGTLLEDHFQHFLDLEIYLYLKWDEYIAKPRHELQMIRTAAERKKRQKNKVESNSVSEIEQLLGQAKSF